MISRPWTRLLLPMTLLLSPLILSSSACVHSKQPVVIPDSLEIKAIEGEIGWFKISGGHLKFLYEQQRILTAELEICQANSLRDGGM